MCDLVFAFGVGAVISGFIVDKAKVFKRKLLVLSLCSGSSAWIERLPPNTLGVSSRSRVQIPSGALYIMLHSLLR